jgi:hypothetical protein
MNDIARGAGERASSPHVVVAPSREAPRADAKFYLTMVLVSAAIIFAGFAPSFYLKSVIHAPPPLTLLTWTHGIVFTGWVVLFITQAWLIVAGKTAYHRQLGIAGAVLFGGMVALALSASITAGRLGHAQPGAPPALAFMSLPLFAIAGALILFLTAMWNRQRSAWHKRLMLASFFIMTGPGTGRIAIPLGFAPQGSQIALIVAELLLAAAMVYDWRRHGQVHRAYWLAVAVFALTHIGVTWAFGGPALWMDFARAVTAT